MKPNQSHVAGLELALNALQDAHLWVGSAEVRKLIGQAKSAPAEVAQGEAAGYRCRFIKEPEHWMVNWRAKSLPDDPNPHAEYQLLYTAPPSPDWREHSRHIAKGEKCPETIETLQAAWDRDQELINDMRHEIARHKTRINRLEQRHPADQVAQPDAELVELLREAREQIEHGDFREGYCMCGSAVEAHGFGDGHSPVDAGVYYAGQAMERIDAKLATLK